MQHAKTVTVFGGSGFIGRYLVKQLAASGWTIRVAVRNPVRARFLKPLGAIGQIVPIACDIRKPEQVDKLVTGVDAVVNLVGILHERGSTTFSAVHTDGAKNIAAAVKTHEIPAFVHLSALGADKNALARYATSKAAGEEAVRKLVPQAVILRPSLVFGPEDQFFNLFAALAQFLPALPLIGGGKTRFQPIYVVDVATAIEKTLTDPTCRGKLYELGGPQIFTFRELLELMLSVTQRRRLLLPMPWSLATFKALFLELLPRPLITRDQVRLLKSDTIVADKALGLSALGITPTALEAILPTYLARFRPGGPLRTHRRA